VGVFTEQGGEVGARGDSRSREVRLKHGGFHGAGRKEWRTRKFERRKAGRCTFILPFYASVRHRSLVLGFFSGWEFKSVIEA